MKMVQRVFIPGDNWLYFKIYTGIRTADWIMTNRIFPSVKKMIKNNYIEKFYFVRYNDPDFHIRLRFLLSSNIYVSDVIDVICRVLKPMIRNQIIWKIQLDTYQREIERYNLHLIESVESIFYIDSMCVIKIIRQLNKIEDEKYRWMISLSLIDGILSDFNFTLEQKKNLMIFLSNEFKSEFGFNKYNSKQINEKYRLNKCIVKAILDKTFDDVDYENLIKILSKRSVEMKSVVCDIQNNAKLNGLNVQNYIGSYIHMSMNRLFRTDNRSYELIIYEFMKRYYLSKLAIAN